MCVNYSWKLFVAKRWISSTHFEYPGSSNRQRGGIISKSNLLTFPLIFKSNFSTIFWAILWVNWTNLEVLFRPVCLSLFVVELEFACSLKSSGQSYIWTNLKILLWTRPFVFASSWVGACMFFVASSFIWFHTHAWFKSISPHNYARFKSISPHNYAWFKFISPHNYTWFKSISPQVLNSSSRLHKC